MDKLAAAFDELARIEGFGSSLSHMADEDSFEDDFEGAEFLEDDEEADILDSSNFDLSDFEYGEKENEPDEEHLDLGNTESDDMDARIAAAKKDMASARVTVPDELERFADEASDMDLRKLGFRKETNPFGDDETPRRESFKLITDAMTCSACGSGFQSSDEKKPGFLPAEKFDIQRKLAKIEEIQKLQEKAETLEWSPEDEIEYLIQTSGRELDDTPHAADIDVDAVAAEMGLDLVSLANKKVICKRCHGLQNSGKVEEALRPGWTEEPTMSQEQFRNLLKPIGEKPAVVVALIDLFDFTGSVLRELDGIAGENPVILAANKVDLLPKKMGKQRAESWVRRELEYMGVQSLANVGGAVRLISCKTGFGVLDMVDKARSLAAENDCDIYIVGAANAGKSTLMNFILGRQTDRKLGKVKAGNKNAFKGALTTSPLPGTTLKFIKVDLGDSMSLYDTPGLLVPGTLTQLLTPEELKLPPVSWHRQVEPITFRVAAGKCVLVGGLARIEVIGDTKPFLFTFFVANEIKLHPTSSDRADEFIKKHAGTLLTPPFEPGSERMEQIGEFESHVFDIDGSGWKEAAADIALTGLGWVAVTGAGTAKVKVTVPKGVGVSVRPPLMPFDVWEVASKYTGSRATRKVTRTKSGQRRKGVGRN
eukprot:scaffold1561_cov129-Cylindrotheca_fusiformis.AAC.9